MKPTRIVVFAKAPQPGAVKTRLIPALGAEGAADLARRMLASTLRSALDARLGPVELCMTPHPSAPEWRNVSLPAGIETVAQVDGDLGARMADAAQRAIHRGEQVILVGTDCVEMSSDLLRSAEFALRAVGAVIHCTVDGGYALLGLTRFDRTVFDEMPWSTARVAGETLRRVARLEWPMHVGQMLHDIDEPADLEYAPGGWLSATASRSRHSRRPHERKQLTVNRHA